MSFPICVNLTVSSVHVTAESVRPKTDKEIGQFATMRSIMTYKIRHKREPHSHNFGTISYANECLITSPLTVFAQTNFLPNCL